MWEMYRALTALPWIVQVGFAGVAAFIIVDLLRPKERPNSPLVRNAVGLPIIGNALEFTPTKILHTLRRYPKDYGPIAAFWFFYRKAYLLTDTELIRDAFVRRPKRLRRRRADEYISDIIGVTQGLFNSNGSEWSRMRRATAPSFSNQNIKNKLPSVVEQIHHWMERLTSLAEKGDVIDMKFESFSFTIRVITVMAFGIDVNNPVTAYFFSPQFVKDINTIFRLVAEFRLFPFPNWLWRYMPHYKYEVAAKEAADRFTDASQKVIDYMKQILAKPGAVPSAMVDFLLYKEAAQSPDALTDAEIIANVKTFFTAGAETNSIAISWAAYVLAQYPAVRDRIRSEAVDVIFKDKKSWRDVDINSVTMDDLTSLTYCNAVGKEILRVLSPAVTGPFELTDQSTPLQMPKDLIVYPGEEVWVNVEGIMRDETVYKDPLAFVPERWLAAEQDPVVLAKMEANFFTFGGGPRACPGMHLSYSELVLAIAYLGHCFDISLACPAEEIERIMNFAASPNKMPLYIRARST